jgi:hypothetical protein
VCVCVCVCVCVRECVYQLRQHFLARLALGLQDDPLEQLTPGRGGDKVNGEGL